MRNITTLLLIAIFVISSCTINVPQSDVAGSMINNNKTIEENQTVKEIPKTVENKTIAEEKIEYPKQEEKLEKIPPIQDEQKKIEEEEPSENVTKYPKTANNKIKIATFNIQIFGKTKREKQEVMDVLKKIARNFDIVAIQEVRDSSETTISFFLNEINSMPGPDYGVVYGERLGRSSSKEQYAYYYNTETVSYIPNSAYTYADSNDVFEREPFVSGFSSGIFDFYLINIHTKPEDAFNEIDKLNLVVKDAESKFTNEKDFIVLGDFNADCTYFKEKADLSALEGAEYYWVVDDSADTTTKSTVCTYDRIVFKKDATLSDYASSWGVFRFDTLYGLNQEMTEDVSDHYPVWAEFYTDRGNDNNK